MSGRGSLLLTQPLLPTVPRRIRNPNCNPDWYQNRQGNSEFVDYVEPMGANYYLIAPNNFFRTTDSQAKVRVRFAKSYKELNF